MDVYEGKNGQNMDTALAFHLFYDLAHEEEYPPAMNMLGCMHYNRENPGESRFINGGDMAMFY